MKTGNRRPETGNGTPEVPKDYGRRTFAFGVRCIRLAESLPKTRTADVLARQLIRAATSVGANYRAALRGRSPAEFVAKFGIVEEECDEALYWIEMLLELGLTSERRTVDLVREANEILAIAVASIKTARKHGR